MNILMINYEFPPFGGGTGTACAGLLDVFAARGDISVDLVTSGPLSGLRQRSLGSGIVAHCLPIPKRDMHYWRAEELARWTLLALGYARRLAAARDYDVCHCWAGWPSGLIGYALRNRVPYIVSLRGSDVPGYSRRLRRLDPLLMRHVARRVWRRSARVVAISRDLRRLALQSEPGAVIDVIPNGIDTRGFRPAKVGSRNLLFVGRLIERKGVDLLLRAFARLAASYPDTTLTLVGDGPERAALERLAGDVAPLGRVRFTGALQSTALADAFAAAGIFVLPSRSEALSNVVLEAMASGLAIVTTRTGATEPLDGNGLVVEPTDAGPLGDAIARYLDDPALLARHQRRSRQLAEGMSWSSVADYFGSLYRDVTAPQGTFPAPAREFSLLPN
jgi:glycosyltransferase involved in cell wall biosynthesis